MNNDNEITIAENETQPIADANTATANEATAPQKTESVVKQELRFDLIFSSLWRHRKTYIIPTIATFVISALLIIGVPRYYTVKVMLAPESTNGMSSNMGGLGSLASMAGINLSSLNSSDAIIPMFYPDLMTSTDFLVPLLNVEVQTRDGSFSGTMADYYLKKNKVFWLQKWIGAAVEAMKKKDDAKLSVNKSGKYEINPFQLNKRQKDLVEIMSGSIKCSVDKKTDVITITTTAQDPLVAALLADTVKMHLQEFITEYRTKKARNDYEHYSELYKQAAKDYEAKQHEYATFGDSYTDVVLPSYKVKEESLENELQMAYNTYTTLKQQMQLAQAKVMENTPAFTTLQNASVPIKPTGPKRMITILACLILCFLATSVYIVYKDKSLKF